MIGGLHYQDDQAFSLGRAGLMILFKHDDDARPLHDRASALDIERQLASRDGFLGPYREPRPLADRL